MILTIHQPEHLPWCGYFNKMSMADTYLLYDDVQFEKNNFQNRNRIMGTNGAQWINVPVNLSGHTKDKINEITIANQSNPKWAKKYLTTLQCSYSRYPFYDEFMPFFDELLNSNHDNLCDLNLKIIYYLAGVLDIKPKFMKSSNVEREGKKNDQILSICKNLNADTYIAGASGKNYLDEKAFINAGIKVIYQDFKHPIYSQFKKEEFTPYLSVIDMLFNIGKEEARELIVG